MHAQQTTIKKKEGRTQFPRNNLYIAQHLKLKKKNEKP